MKNIRILDCTLRDGGRVIDCAFADGETRDISRRLAGAGIDIVELGFLRDPARVEYKGNSTFFTRVEQLRPFVAPGSGTLFVAFIDYNLYDFSTLSPCDGSSVTGLRVGFTKKDLAGHREDLIRCLKLVKSLGYRLFVQGVNSLGYSDRELLEIVEMVNEIGPDGFGIVDTYGAMYIEDVQRIYGLIDHNLAPGIAIDFHSHNNFQLSFAFAQEVIRLSGGSRPLVLDATLNGMGKCAGNLNTELIVDYLVRKKHQDYDFDAILDLIDEYMYQIKAEHPWGYSIPAVMAGIYKSHPNNVIYLTEKFRLATKDIEHILSMIDPEVRQRYDYDNIQRLYAEYNHTRVDDRAALETLGQALRGQQLLLLLPGKSLVTHARQIDELIAQKDPVILSANFVTDKGRAGRRFAFFGSEKRYKKFAAAREGAACIVVSNIAGAGEGDLVVNYENLVDRASGIGGEEFDNTMVMLLNLLRRLGVRRMDVAGFDGFAPAGENYYDEAAFDKKRFAARFAQINANMSALLREYAKGLDRPEDLHFVTPSLYAPIFGQQL